MAVTSYDNGAVGVEVQYWQTECQVVAEEWWLVMEGDAWKLNAIENETATVDGDTAAVGVNLLENEDGTYAIAPNTASVVATEVLILQADQPGRRMLNRTSSSWSSCQKALIRWASWTVQFADEDIVFIGVDRRMSCLAILPT